MTIERRHATAGKPKKTKTIKVAEIGSLNRGPYFFLDKSCMIKLSAVSLNS
jgi:hypothetical protein